MFGESGMFKGLISFLMVIFSSISLLFGLPTLPKGEELDLDKFELTWSDEFDGDSLDLTKWRDHHRSQGEATVRRGGYWHRDMAVVEDGKLNIKTAYMENGVGGGPAAYYSAGIDTNGLFEQKYGYFEVSCRLPKGEGQWAAFWMLTDSMWEETGNGHSGAEIDIFESPYFNKIWPYNNVVSSAVHIDGYGEAHKQFPVGKFFVDKPYDTFNTYGLEWNEDEYIFYINGVETNRGNFGGVSRTPQYLILSVEIGNATDVWDGIPGNSWAGDLNNNIHLPSSFEIDYVRVYQYKDLLS